MLHFQPAPGGLHPASTVCTTLEEERGNRHSGPHSGPPGVQMKHLRFKEIKWLASVTRPAPRPSWPTECPLPLEP